MGGTVTTSSGRVAAMHEGSDDTPGAGMTLWTGWHVLESFKDETTSVTITASAVSKWLIPFGSPSG